MRYEFTQKLFSASARAKTLAVFIVLGFGVLGVSARGWLGSRPNNSKPPARLGEALLVKPTPTFGPQPNTDKGRIVAPMEVERVTIKPSGFEPAEIRRPAGPFLLAFTNYSKSAEVSVGVYRNHGQKLHELRGSKGQVRQQQILDLSPGEYVLKEANHPEWNCRILISPK
jgi:hypothetical protein